MSGSPDTADKISALGYGPEARQWWLAVMAKATLPELEQAWTEVPDKPDFRVLRAPEIGLAMVRGRIGGTGAPFNMGEMTMTRAAVQMLDASGTACFTGFGYIAGRSARHAELVAIFDALLQDPRHRQPVLRGLIVPLAERHEAGRAHKAAKAQASKVEFFTLVRGE
ncbi:MAG: phosphonate C-P lyase system protein PhnG [Alphaproteobacteria bacterium]|nr:phosphonate C-P lyase system protein PhnG [Alphaproteobacteria bacterium]